MSDLIEWRTQVVTGDEGEDVEQSIWRIKESVELDPTKAASIAEVTAGRDGLKIKQHSPLTAMKQLAELAGYEKPKETLSKNINIDISEDMTPAEAAKAYNDLMSS